MTASEICAEGEKLSQPSFSRHKDAFLRWGVLAEAGTDEHGNQLYIKNVRHPLLQVMQMVDRVALTGSMRMLIEDEFVRELELDKPMGAYPVEAADSISEKIVLCEKFELDPEEWIDEEELEEYHQRGE